MDKMEQKEEGLREKRQEISNGEDRSKGVRKFFGREITPTNRNSVRNEFFEHFLNVEINREEFKELKEKSTNDEILKLALFYANFNVRKEQIHYKAFLKGKKRFVYKGIKYPVMTFDHNTQMASETIKQEIVKSK